MYNITQEKVCVSSPMRIFKLTGVLAASMMILICFLPWVLIESKGIIITGVSTTGTNFGKPGVLHLFFTGAYLALLAIPHVWSRRINLFFGAFNLAWAVRNFILISACYGGECPQKKMPIYLLVILSIAMLAVVMFAPEKERQRI